MLPCYQKEFKRKREPVQIMRNGREVCNLDTCYGRRDYKRRVKAMWERQHGWCAICGDPLRLEEATYDHDNGRGLGGGHRDDRIEVNGVPQNTAVHLMCNVRKGSVRLEKFKEAS